MAAMAEESDSDSDDEFEGFTASDFMLALRKQKAELVEVSMDELSDISFDESESESSKTDSDTEIDNSSESSSSDDEQLPEGGVKWRERLSAIRIPAFTSREGPSRELEAEANEKDFLNLLFPDIVFDILAIQTNLYAEQLQEKNGIDKHWTDTNQSEMKAYIGMRIYMSILQLPAMDMYWSTDYMFGNLFVPNVMPRDRFDKICQYFHANDSTENPRRGQPDHDKLHHIRPIMDIVNKRCQRMYHPHQNTSVDEAMIAFRGRLGFRQYLPAKPTKYGIKVWMRADSENGFCNEFEIYTGKKDDVNHEIGLCTRVVLNLTEKIARKHHIVNIDNYFTSVDLLSRLKDRQTYARGTARSNRKNFPSKTLTPKCVKNQGDLKVVQSDYMAAYAWKDKKTIFFLSSADDPTQRGTEVQRRQKDGTQKAVPSPIVVSKYNVKMNGVDKNDQLRTEYPTFRMCKRWWIYIFYFLLDLAIANAFILMRESPNHKLKTKTGKDKERTLLNFRMNLVKQLIGNFRIGRKRKRVSNIDPNGVGHWPQAAEKRGRCKQCTKNGDRSDVKWQCSGCKVHLCVTCFENFHK